MPEPRTATADEVKARVARDVAAFRPASRADAATLAAFRAALREPRLVTVNFSGGLAHKCWLIARTAGDYGVIYMPRADYFSLCVDSDFGPLDIGVHGDAIGCFGSV